MVFNVCKDATFPKINLRITIHNSHKQRQTRRENSIWEIVLEFGTRIHHKTPPVYHQNPLIRSLMCVKMPRLAGNGSIREDLTTKVQMNMARLVSSWWY